MFKNNLELKIEYISPKISQTTTSPKGLSISPIYTIIFFSNYLTKQIDLKSYET